MKNEAKAYLAAKRDLKDARDARDETLELIKGAQENTRKARYGLSLELSNPEKRLAAIVASRRELLDAWALFRGCLEEVEEASGREFAAYEALCPHRLPPTDWAASESDGAAKEEGHQAVEASEREAGMRMLGVIGYKNNESGNIDDQFRPTLLRLVEIKTAKDVVEATRQEEEKYGTTLTVIAHVVRDLQDLQEWLNE